MDLIELTPIKDALVGIPGSGLSVEQHKRLTIAMELVANPSIVFMDEPTSGLDARGAGLVMRAVKATVGTGRTVVCTIHQPSIEIFEAFSELLLLKRGGGWDYGRRRQAGRQFCWEWQSRLFDASAAGMTRTPSSAAIASPAQPPAPCPPPHAPQARRSSTALWARMPPISSPTSQRWTAYLASSRASTLPVSARLQIAVAAHAGGTARAWPVHRPLAVAVYPHTPSHLPSADWMLEITSPDAEKLGGNNFAALYAGSDLAAAAVAMVDKFRCAGGLQGALRVLRMLEVACTAPIALLTSPPLLLCRSVPPEGEGLLRLQDLHVCSQAVQTRELLVRNTREMLRDFSYNGTRGLITLVRVCTYCGGRAGCRGTRPGMPGHVAPPPRPPPTLQAISIIFATLFANQGQETSTVAGVLNVAGAMYAASTFLSVLYMFMVQDALVLRRTVFYRVGGAGTQQGGAAAAAQSCRGLAALAPPPPSCHPS